MSDTIAAIATAVGDGAIAVIRVSGSEAHAITDKIFVGRTRISDAQGYSVLYGRLVDLNEEFVDQVLVTVFRAPSSYTGENLAEISCHGGTLITNKVLQAVIKAGARQAEPGEFTRRAFLNGKVDLSQAEAVAGLIAGKSERAIAASRNQLQGRLAERISATRANMINLCSLLELELDFAEEGISLLEKVRLKEKLEAVLVSINKMIDSYETGRLFSNGICVVIIGEPNVGKSSLFNALLHENRAIVTPIAGTTRDFIEESIVVSGFLVKLVDTAGLRKTSDTIENEGVKRTKHLMASADLILLVADVTMTRNRDQLIELIGDSKGARGIVVVYNKVDLLKSIPLPPTEFRMGGKPSVELFTSAKTGYGISDLRSAFVKIVCQESVSDTLDCYVISERHRESLRKSADYLVAAINEASIGTNNEIIAIEVRSAADALSEITGEITNDDVLNNIFSKFCIGK